MKTIEVFEHTLVELEQAVSEAEATGECTDIPCLLDSLSFFLPQIIHEDFGVDLEEQYRTKYRALVNALLEAARISQITGKLYLIDDDSVYAVLRALEPQLYEAKCKELQ